MGKLLNNPLFVGLLVLAAMAAASWNVLWPALKTLSVSKQVLTGLDPFQREEDMKKKEIVSRIDLKSAGWIDWPRRDPFQPPLTLSAPRLEKGEAAHAPEEGEEAMALREKMLRATERFRLAAVLIEPGLRYATINGLPVSEGGMIDGYKVLRIERDAVVISGPLGQERLTFVQSPMGAVVPEESKAGTGEDTVDEER